MALSKGLIVFLIILGILLIFFLNSESYTRGQVCGTHTETYESTTKGCDQRNNCECLHKSWGGLGSCDSCECTRQVSNC
mgnify:CR=1 FL=1